MWRLASTPDAGGMERTTTPLSTGAWIRLIMLGAITAVLALAGAYYTLLELGSDCSPVPDPNEMSQGRTQLVAIVLIAVTPWLVAWVRTGGRRMEILVVGALAAVPPFIGAVYGIANDSAWTGGMCIPF